MSGRDYVVWEETAKWPWWASTIMAICVVGGAAWAVMDAVGGLATGRPDAVVRGLLVAGSVLLLGLIVRTALGRLRVVVTRSAVTLTYGYTHLIEMHVPFGEIEEVEAVRYSPIRDFGGWGIRFGGGRKRAWTVRGDGAVVLTLDDGTRLYVGSDDPERLADRIRRAMSGDEEGDATRPGREGDADRTDDASSAGEADREPTHDEDTGAA